MSDTQELPVNGKKRSVFKQPKPQPLPQPQLQPEPQPQPEHRRVIKNISFWEQDRKALAQYPYVCHDKLAFGAEAVLYRATCNGRLFCVKAIRNSFARFLGTPPTNQFEGKLKDVSYKTKVRHLKNEFEISKHLYNDGDLPIVHIYDLRRITRFGIEIGYDLLMEFFEGKDLADKDFLKRRTLEDKISYLFQAVQALDYLHKKNIVHMDIKPSNFMLTNGGDSIRLLDFGVSVPRRTKAQSITGTGGYLSPEQICKDTLTDSTDIFALGVTFGVIFGSKPLNQPQETLLSRQGGQEAKYMLNHSVDPSLADIPELASLPKFAQILRQCTIPRRDKRIATCSELLSKLMLAASESGFELEEF